MARLLAIIAALLCLLPSAAIAADGKKCALLLEHKEAAPYTDLLRKGFSKAGSDFGLETSVIIADEDSDQEEAFRKAAAENDLIIVATDNMHEILRDNAANYRRKKFGVIDAGIRAPNVTCVTFADEQAAFLAGAAAAMLAKARNSSTIGWLSGMDTPAMRSLFSGFSAGAEMAVPNIRVIQAVVDSFTDPQTAAAKAAQLAMLQDTGADGASVIALAAGAGNQAAAQALKGSATLVISLDAWQPNLLPGQVCAGIAKSLDRAIWQICEDFAKDRFKAKEIAVFDLANRGVALQGLDEFAQKKYPDVIRRVKELAGELEKGGITLRSMRQRTLCDCLD